VVGCLHRATRVATAETAANDTLRPNPEPSDDELPASERRRGDSISARLRHAGSAADGREESDVDLPNPDARSPSLESAEKLGQRLTAPVCQPPSEFSAPRSTPRPHDSGEQETHANFA
jgi:hypothetical protein